MVEILARFTSLQLLVSIIFCLLEWTINSPVAFLVELEQGHRSLLYKVFRVLSLAATGAGGALTPRSSQSDMSLPEMELERLREFPNDGRTSTSPDGAGAFGSRSPRQRVATNDGLRLAARTVLSSVLLHVPLSIIQCSSENVVFTRVVCRR